MLLSRVLYAYKEAHSIILFRKNPIRWLLSVRYCSKCGAERVADAAFCHKCGASFTAPVQGKDHFGLGLLLISIGAVLAMTLPLLTIVGVNFFSGGAFLGAMQGMFAGVIAVIIGIGVLFGAIAFKFHQDIAGGNHERIVHAMILAAVMFFLGSNIAGIAIGVGAFLCYSSPRRVARPTL